MDDRKSQAERVVIPKAMGEELSVDILKQVGFREFTESETKGYLCCALPLRWSMRSIAGSGSRDEIFDEKDRVRFKISYHVSLFEKSGFLRSCDRYPMHSFFDISGFPYAKTIFEVKVKDYPKGGFDMGLEMIDSVSGAVVWRSELWKEGLIGVEIDIRRQFYLVSNWTTHWNSDLDPNELTKLSEVVRRSVQRAKEQMGRRRR